MKFVIWGAGKFGKRALLYLTEKRVEAFIESNVTLQNTRCNGIPIISYEQYKERYKKYPIIVSPLGYEEEIIELLHRDGIEWAFPFKDNMNSIMGFLLQAPIEKLMCNYKREHGICIYGFNPLGIILYEYLVQRGYSCKIIFQNSFSIKGREFVRKIMKIESIDISDISLDDKVILAMKIETDDRFRGCESVADFVDLGLRRDLYFNPLIAELKDSHAGERCFIVATGPSLQVNDLDRLHENKEVCFSVNGIFKIFDKTVWRPDYYIISDPLGMVAWKENIIEMNVKKKFISDIAWQFEQGEVSENMYKWHFHHEWPRGEKPEFSDDFSKCGIFGYTVTYEGALQLAVYMGFKKIYLLGVDCKQYDEKDKQHFVANYNTEGSNLQINEIIMAYQAAKEYADTHGIKIYNATRGGKLEVFERVDFDSLFE